MKNLLLWRLRHPNLNRVPTTKIIHLQRSIETGKFFRETFQVAVPLLFLASIFIVSLSVWSLLVSHLPAGSEMYDFDFVVQHVASSSASAPELATPKINGAGICESWMATSVFELKMRGLINGILPGHE